MHFEDIKSAEAKVKRACENWTRLREHFAAFVKSAGRFGQPDCAIKGIAIVSASADELVMEFVNRRLRIWMDFDRDAERGLLVVDDVTDCTGRSAPPIRIGTLAFDYSGATDLAAGNAVGTKANLSQPQDAWHLTMSILDKALAVTLSDVSAPA